jgi:hypothetical protein
MHINDFPDQSINEDRFIDIGMSALKATADERKIYEKERKS